MAACSRSRLSSMISNIALIVFPLLLPRQNPPTGIRSNKAPGWVKDFRSQSQIADNPSARHAKRPDTRVVRVSRSDAYAALSASLARLFPIGRHPFVAFDQHLAVGGHAGFGETLRISESQLHADHLF